MEPDAQPPLYRALFDRSDGSAGTGAGGWDGRAAGEPSRSLLSMLVARLHREHEGIREGPRTKKG